MQHRRLRLTILVAVTAVLLVIAVGPRRASAQDFSTSTTVLPAEAANGGAGLDMRRIEGPRVEDSSPGHVAGLGLALGAVAIVGVVGAITFTARRNQRLRAQLSEGSGGQ